MNCPPPDFSISTVGIHKTGIWQTNIFPVHWHHFLGLFSWIFFCLLNITTSFWSPHDIKVYLPKFRWFLVLCVPVPLSCSRTQETIDQTQYEHSLPKPYEPAKKESVSLKCVSISTCRSRAQTHAYPSRRKKKSSGSCFKSTPCSPPPTPLETAAENLTELQRI